MTDRTERDLLGSWEWHGEFFPPGKADQRFGGHLTYSPADGVRLTYAMLGYDTPSLSGILHGVLSNGEPVTLFRHGELQPGMTYRHGVHSRQGNVPVGLLCVGALFDAEPAADAFDFSLSGLDEFVVPGGRTACAVWSLEPIVTAPMPGGVLQLINAGTAQSVRSLRSVLFNRNQAAMDELEHQYQAVSARFPSDEFLVKQTMHYALRLQYQELTGLDAALQRLQDICALFALLVRSPVHPRWIGFRIDPGIGVTVPVEVYLSEYLEEGTVRLALEKRSHHTMPITLANAQLPQLIPAWLTEAVNHRVLVSGLQHRTGWSTQQDTHGSLVLYATQIEGIHLEEQGPKGLKYEYPIGKYGSPLLNALLQKRFGAASAKEVAEGIAGLRNEIAHVGRPAKLLQKLSARHLLDIALCLELVVVGYVLRRLGVAPSVVTQYQGGFAPSD